MLYAFVTCAYDDVTYAYDDVTYEMHWPITDLLGRRAQIVDSKRTHSIVREHIL